jgi:hypothetical protein
MHNVLSHSEESLVGYNPSRRSSTAEEAAVML